MRPPSAPRGRRQSARAGVNPALAEAVTLRLRRPNAPNAAAFGSAWASPKRSRRSESGARGSGNAPPAAAERTQCGRLRLRVGRRQSARAGVNPALAEAVTLRLRRPNAPNAAAFGSAWASARRSRRSESGARGSGNAPPAAAERTQCGRLRLRVGVGKALAPE